MARPQRDRDRERDLRRMALLILQIIAEALALKH